MTTLILAARNLQAARWAQDRVLLALALFFAGLLAVDWAQALASGVFVVEALLRIAPFLALSVGLAAWLKAAGADRLMARIAGRAPLFMVALAAAAGIVKPTTPVVTTVHAMQVLDEELPFTQHDVPIDFVATPEELIRCSEEMPRPSGIYWDDLDEVKIARIPVLQKMRLTQR